MVEEVIKKLVYTTKELRIIKSINKIIHSTDNLDVLITKLMKLINKELRVALIFLTLQDQEGNIDIKKTINIDLHPDFEDLLRVITEDTTKSVSPIFVKQSRPNTRLRRFNIRSMISAPLMSYSGPLGAIIIMAQYRNFQLSTLKLLTAIASQSASAVEHLLLRKTVEEKEKKIVRLYSKLYKREAKRAIIDALTGLFNKRYFVELLDLEAKKGKQLSLIMFDLDFFKNYNDTFGHLEGDNLLRAAGKIIQKRCKNMKACRYGGEEFAIIVESDISRAAHIAEELRQAIEALYPKEAKRLVTASFGVAQRRKGEDIEHFIKRTDDALYKAKQSGRNRVCVAS